MKNNYKFLLLLPLLFATTTACNKYLDVQPKGKQLLLTTNDYDQWLNSPNLTYDADIANLCRMSDLVDNPTIVPNSTLYSDLIYLWGTQFTDAGTTPYLWTAFYYNISLFNTVIIGVDGASGPDAQKKTLKAEALLGRAYEYLYLVNLYGNVYDAATASEDQAVPFVTSSDVTALTPVRSSVNDIYTHIIADINTALPNLPSDNTGDRYRGSVSAAYSVLARTYFYMRDYVNASKYAQMALQVQSLAMLDYNGITSAGQYPTFPLLAVRKDAIYARVAASISNLNLIGATGGGLVATPSLDFLNSYNSKDLRLFFVKNKGNTVTPTGFITRGAYQYVTGQGNGFETDCGTSVAEMKLIIAEGAARYGDLTTALQQLNDIRKFRFPASSYQLLTSSNQTTVLNWVLSERVYELPFTGLRWLDMRRLAKEGLMPSVNRYDGSGKVIATLQPNSPRYTLQIPLNVLVYNPGWSQNP